MLEDLEGVSDGKLWALIKRQSDFLSYALSLQQKLKNVTHIIEALLAELKR